MPVASPTPQSSGGVWGALAAWFRRLLGGGDREEEETGTGQEVAGRPQGAASTRPSGRLPNTQVLGRKEEAIKMFQNRFVTLRSDIRPTFGFYEVYDSHCPHCRSTGPTMAGGGRQQQAAPAAQPAQGAQCPECGQPLPVYLFYVTRLHDNPDLDPKDIVRLSQGHPFILDHLYFWQEGDQFVVMLAYPPGWKPLYQLVPIQDTRQIADWGMQLGQALAYLHHQRVTHFSLYPSSVEGIVIHDGKAKLPDLTEAKALVHLDGDSVQQGEKAQKLIQRDIIFLARAVDYMASGQSRPLAVETAFSEMLARAFNGEYATVDQFNTDLKTIRDGREVGLKISFSFGQATGAGRVRSANQDSAIVLPMIRLQESKTIATALCIVADGMGGQESGERAAKLAYKAMAAEINTQLIMPALAGEVTQKLYATPGEILKGAVAKANQKVYEVAHQQRINMGTTVTAALLEGPRAYVVNVGDSRTYRLRNGVLEKVTRDHSLVANLVQAGVITEEEVYTHPNRNQIFRSLGEKPEVEVDLFPIDLKKGDQLVLCSDGLWEMVRDPQIRDILLWAPDPQTACEALVRAANDAGGEDNITVIVARVNQHD